LAIVVTMLLWAGGFVIVRYLRPYFGAGEVVLARFGGAGLLLTVLLARQRHGRPARADAARIFAIGGLWFGLNNLMLNAGEKLIDAGTAAMLGNVSPVFVAIAAAIALHERLGRRLIGGLVVALAGGIVIGLASGHRHGNLAGAALCLFSAVPFALAVAIQKPLLGRVSATLVTWGACLSCTLLFLPFAPDLVSELERAPAGYIWLLALLATASAVAFTAWAYALTYSGLAAQGVSTYLVPVLAVLLAWIALAEVPTALAFVGGALCLAGVAVAQGRGPRGAAIGGSRRHGDDRIAR
jgi:drug/metabolite transporter (DMT)-like permease